MVHCRFESGHRTSWVLCAVDVDTGAGWKGLSGDLWRWQPEVMSGWLPDSGAVGILRPIAQQAPRCKSVAKAYAVTLDDTDPEANRSLQ